MTQNRTKYLFRQSPGQSPRRNRSTGFTLIELAVAMTIILLIVTMVIPTLTTMLSSRAREEAFNLVSAQLTAARAEAISSDTYAGIHVQPGALNSSHEDTVYSMIIGVPDPKLPNPKFTRHAAFLPQDLPGGTALGQLTKYFVEDKAPTDPQNADYSGEYKNIGTDSLLREFCTFSIIFTPDGSVATQVKDGNVMFNANDAMFASGDRQLWDYTLANNKPGITAFTIFDYRKVLKLDGQKEVNGITDRERYLNENGQFLPVNMHTGQLIERR